MNFWTLFFEKSVLIYVGATAKLQRED